MEIVFKKVAQSNDVANYIFQSIFSVLKNGKKVLWFVPGGSAISIVVEVSKLISATGLDNGLTVTLTDERYGPVGHKDSNWQQLLTAGLNFPHANLLPTLIGEDQATTVSSYTIKLKKAIEQADYIIGLFGLGADGHTAGILPQSAALNSSNLVVSYQATDFERITITPDTISQLDEALVYAVGASKWPQLDKLRIDIEISAQPAQALKKVKKLTIFSDQPYENNN